MRLAWLPLLACLVSCGRGEVPPAAHAPSDALEWKTYEYVAALGRNDEISALYAGRVLKHAGIRYSIHGSLGYGLSVPPSRRAQAEQLLRAEEGLRYHLRLGNDDAPRGVTRSSVVAVNSSMKEALDTHTEDTVVGQILRRLVARDSFILGRYGKVVEVRWASRPFVTKDLAPTSAIDAVVIIERFPGKPVQFHASVMPEE
jgi:hypothetical protein